MTAPASPAAGSSSDRDHNGTREEPAAGPDPTRAFGAIYTLLRRTQTSRARVWSLLALGGLGIVVALGLGLSDPLLPEEAGQDFVNLFGLSLLVPVGSLIFASAVFGDLRDDESMVYLWLRPVPSWVVVGAGWAAALTVTLPVIVIPLAVMAALTGGGSELIVGTVAAASLGVVAYTALFLALGMRIQRALVWGLAYILIWEGFVAQAGKTASRVALRAYTRSVLSDSTGVPLDLGAITPPWSWLVPLAVAAAALAYATHHFRTQDVA